MPWESLKVVESLSWERQFPHWQTAGVGLGANKGLEGISHLRGVGRIGRIGRMWEGRIVGDR